MQEVLETGILSYGVFVGQLRDHLVMASSKESNQIEDKRTISQLSVIWLPKGRLMSIDSYIKHSL